MRRRTLILGAASAVVVGAGTLAAAVGGWQAFRRQAKAETDPRIPPSLPGMDWQMTDQTGRTVVPADWIGRPTLVFFGFTFCPDVCPTTLLRIASWIEELGKLGDLGEAAAAMRVVLITIDPERDTPEVLANYLASIAPGFDGLTGTPDQISAVAAAFRAFYRKVPQEGGGYTMDHTASVFLFAADGSFSGIVDAHEDHNLAMLKIERLLSRRNGPRGDDRGEEG